MIERCPVPPALLPFSAVGAVIRTKPGGVLSGNPYYLGRMPMAVLAKLSVSLSECSTNRGGDPFVGSILRLKLSLHSTPAFHCCGAIDGQRPFEYVYEHHSRRQHTLLLHLPKDVSRNSNPPGRITRPLSFSDARSSAVFMPDVNSEPGQSLSRWGCTDPLMDCKECRRGARQRTSRLTKRHGVS